MPEKVEECVRSVLDENPEYDEERAYAICNAADNRGNLEDGSFDPADPISLFLSEPKADFRVALTRGLAGSDEKPIKRVEEDGKVRYTNVMLLGPGEWTDAASRTTILYAPDAIRESAQNWIDPRTGNDVEKAPLNHFHEHDVPSENVGHVDVGTVHADDRGHLYGDIVFHMRTQRSEEMESMMRLAMEENGQEGLGGVSVEIPMDETRWDDDRQMERMTEMWFSGAAVVMNPASATVNFAKQSERAVALSGEAGPRSVYLRDTTPKPDGTASGAMRDDELPPAVRRLRELQDEMDEVVEEVGDETDMAMEAVQTYLSQEGADESDDVTAFRAWADEALDDPLRSAVMSALDSFMDGNEDGAEMSVGDFTEWASGTGDESGDESGTTPEEPESPEELQDEEGDSPEAPEGDGGDGGDGGPGPDEETVKEVADTMEAVAETVKQTSETLKKEVDENADAVEELRATLAGIEKRLSDIADESEPRTLSGEGASEEDRMPESTVPKPRRTTDGYIQR